MVQGLVYDVGMNNGDDTAYYLAKGYRVVAVEADPTLVDHARRRFQAEHDAGQLVIVNYAVGPQSGSAKFWICPSSRVWNSFDEAVAGRGGLDHYSIDVPVRRFRDIMQEHGVPYFLKADIEGYDRYCLDDIDPSDRPLHLSWEMSRVADLFMVASKGYNAFKCVSQSEFRPLELGWRRGTRRVSRMRQARRHAMAMLSRSPVVERAVRSVYRAVKRRAPSPGAAPGIQDHAPIVLTQPIGSGSWDFRFGSSGPFGPDLGGAWKTVEEVAYDYSDFWLYRGRHGGDDWFDIHATTLPPNEAPRLEWSIG